MRLYLPKIILAVAVVGLCLSAASMMSASQKTADYKIGVTRLNIPKDFLFLSPVRQRGDGGIVAFLWPELKPKSGIYYAKFSVPGGGNVVRVRMSPTMNWEGLRQVNNEGKIAESSFGLKSVTPTKPYGMSGWTYFIAPEDADHEESYLSCMTGPVPQCTHDLKYGDFYLSISYRKALLPDWSKIRDASFDLLKQWEVSE